MSLLNDKMKGTIKLDDCVKELTDRRKVGLGILVHHYLGIDSEYEDLRKLKRVFKASKERIVKQFNGDLPGLSNCSIRELAIMFNANVRIFENTKRTEIPKLLIEIFIGRKKAMVMFDMLERDYKKSDFSKMTLVANHKMYLTPKSSFTIFELIGQKTDLDVDEVKALLKRSVISLDDEAKLVKHFGFGLNIYSCSYKTNRRMSRKRLFASRAREWITLIYVGRSWSDEKSVIYESDKFRIVPDESIIHHRCRFAGCYYNSFDLGKVKRHEISCTNEVQMRFKQINFCAESSRDWLIKKGYLRKEVQPTLFCSFDIETLSTPDNRVRGQNTHVIGQQALCLVSLTKNFGSGRTTVIQREDMSETAYYAVLNRFIKLVKQFSFERLKYLDPQIDQSLALLNETIQKVNDKEITMCPVDKKKITDGRKYLISLKKMKVVGFNSEKFDLPVLLAGLLKCYHDQGNLMEIIKNGSGIMQLSNQFIAYNDVRRFTAGGSLDTFCRTWKVDTSKAVFPYEAFQTISSLKAAYNWPPISKFKSSLRMNRTPLKNMNESLRKALDYLIENAPQMVSDFKRMLCLDLFYSNVPEQVENSFDFKSLVLLDENKCLPICPISYVMNWIKFKKLQSDADGQFNMHNFYTHYASIDTEILCEAYERYCKKFIEVYDTNPLEFISLPSVAGCVVWKQYTKDVAAAFSFSKEFGHINKLIRQNIRGGLSAVFHRHAEVGLEERYGDSVHKLNGKPIKTILSYDFNSKFIIFSVKLIFKGLYAYCMQQALPCGPGFCYEKDGKGFRWRSMLKKTDNWSLESIEWLNFMQNQEPYRSLDQQIRHAMNFGEEKLELLDPETNDLYGFKPDGFIDVHGVTHFLFYDGCRFHECEHQCTTSRNSPHTRDDTQRDRVCKHHGVLVKISGCMWEQLRKEVEYVNHTSVFFNRQSLISEEEIWQKIDSKELFGMIEVDIETPLEAQDPFLRMNFPPVFSHVNVTEEMVGETMAQRVNESSNRKFPLEKQLTLRFHAKKHLITTEMALFYKERGMKLSNMTLCLEYQKGYPLKKFIDNITQQRIEATYSGDESLATIVKLTGNASYGKTIMNLSKRVKYVYLRDDDKEEISKLKRVLRESRLEGEFSTNYMEYVRKPKYLTDFVPGKFPNVNMSQHEVFLS